MVGNCRRRERMAHTTLEQVTQLADDLSPEDQRSLVDHLMRKLRETRETGIAEVQEEHRAPQDLYGIWRGRFPDDLDIDGILYEIRHEWEAEWPEVFPQ